MRLDQLGEWELIERLSAYAPEGQLADDAAILSPSRPGAVVVNTDVLVDTVHFSDATMSPQDLGWRAAAANLSDLAAMGCRDVLGLTVGLVAPGDTTWNWVEGVYQGLSEALERYGGRLLGGDCSSGQQRLLAITALGSLGPGPIRRGDGQPGDWLVSTGPHGLSRLGLALLQNQLEEPVPADLRQRAIQAHQRPRPRLDAIGALEASQPQGSPWRVCGTDSSDGLQRAVLNLAHASGCGAQLQRTALPCDPAMAVLASGERWCLNGGEDFELVLALEPAWAQRLCAALPGCQVIGELVAAASPALSWSESGLPLSDNDPGYRHFS